MATGIRGLVICGAPTVVRKLPVKYGRTKNNTKNGDKMSLKTHIYSKMLVLKTQIFEKHIFVSMENMKSKIDNDEK